MRKLDIRPFNIAEKGRRREIIHKKVREAEEEVREAGDVYPLPPPPLIHDSFLVTHDACDITSAQNKNFKIYLQMFQSVHIFLF